MQVCCKRVSRYQAHSNAYTDLADLRGLFPCVLLGPLFRGNSLLSISDVVQSTQHERENQVCLCLMTHASQPRVSASVEGSVRVPRRAEDVSGSFTRYMSGGELRDRIAHSPKSECSTLTLTPSRRLPALACCLGFYDLRTVPITGKQKVAGHYGGALEALVLNCGVENTRTGLSS